MSLKRIKIKYTVWNSYIHKETQTAILEQFSVMLFRQIEFSDKKNFKDYREIVQALLSIR